MVSRRPWSVPEPCTTVYERYIAGLENSGLAPSTRKNLARCVRRFLRWLPEDVNNVDAALTQPQAWQHAVNRFTGELAAIARQRGPSTRWHRYALADCTRRLGLAQPRISVPDQFQWIYSRYISELAASSLSPATRRSNQVTVGSFLRWLGQRGYDGDLRSGWDSAEARYLHHLSSSGNAPSSVIRRRAALKDCAARLQLPTPTQTASGSSPPAGIP